LLFDKTSIAVALVIRRNMIKRYLLKSTPSTAQNLSIRERFLEDARLLQKYLERPPSNFDSLFSELSEYDRLLQHYTGKRLGESRVFEIGYGARPYRMLALAAMGVDVQGIDAEVPILEGKLREYLTLFQTNGLERALKSLIRYLISDPKERTEFMRALAQRGYKHHLYWQHPRFQVGDAAEHDVPGPQYDLVYSIDVFEHINQKQLETLVAKMASWLYPNGIALIQPDIWTGISGGHLPEWYPGTVDSTSPRRSEPWEHLRKGRFNANTTLNGLTRQEYRNLFCVHFEILDEIERHPGLGSQHLTPGLREELAAYSTEDLLYAHPLFVLRPHRSRDVQ
jgi:hypothetical protein